MHFSLLVAMAPVLALLTTCRAPDSSESEPAVDDAHYLRIDREAGLEFFRAPVVELADAGGGDFYISFEPYARRFKIDHETSLHAERMAAFAREAMASGRRVYATIEIRSRAPKTPPSTWDEEPVFDLVIRLADDRDPRAPE